MTATTSKLGEKMDEKEIRALAVKHRLPMITRPGEYPWSYIDNVMAFATELLSASQPAAIDGQEARDPNAWREPFEERHQFDVYPDHFMTGLRNEFAAGWHAALKEVRGESK